MWRVTFTPALIDAGRAVAFMVSGAGKAAVLKAVLHGEYQPDVYPVEVVRPTAGERVWFVDQAAMGT